MTSTDDVLPGIGPASTRWVARRHVMGVPYLTTLRSPALVAKIVPRLAVIALGLLVVAVAVAALVPAAAVRGALPGTVLGTLVAVLWLNRRVLADATFMGWCRIVGKRDWQAFPMGWRDWGHLRRVRAAAADAEPLYVNAPFGPERVKVEPVPRLRVIDALVAHGVSPDTYPVMERPDAGHWDHLAVLLLRHEVPLPTVNEILELALWNEPTLRRIIEAVPGLNGRDVPRLARAGMFLRRSDPAGTFDSGRDADRAIEDLTARYARHGEFTSWFLAARMSEDEGDAFIAQGRPLDEVRLLVAMGEGPDGAR